MIWESYEGCQIIGSQSNGRDGVRRPRYALNAQWSCHCVLTQIFHGYEGTFFRVPCLMSEGSLGQLWFNLNFGGKRVFIDSNV